MSFPTPQPAANFTGKTQEITLYRPWPFPKLPLQSIPQLQQGGKEGQVNSEVGRLCHFCSTGWWRACGGKSPEGEPELLGSVSHVHKSGRRLCAVIFLPWALMFWNHQHVHKENVPLCLSRSQWTPPLARQGAYLSWPGHFEIQTLVRGKVEAGHECALIRKCS